MNFNPIILLISDIVLNFYEVLILRSITEIRRIFGPIFFQTSDLTFVASEFKQCCERHRFRDTKSFSAKKNVINKTARPLVALI